MTQTEPLTPEEFSNLPGFRNKSPELEALQKLAAGEGFRMPCRFTHKQHHCPAHSLLYNGAKRRGITISKRCHQGTLYVVRIK